MRAKATLSEQSGRKSQFTRKDKEDYVWVREMIGKAILREYPIQHLVSLFVLADKLQVQGLKDPILDQIVSTYAIRGLAQRTFWKDPERNMTPMINAINTGYRELPEESNFPHLLIHMYCLNSTDEQVLRDSALLDHGVLVQAFNLTQSVYREERTPSDDMKDYCQYHNHDTGPCAQYVPDIDTNDEKDSSTEGITLV